MRTVKMFLYLLLAFYCSKLFFNSSILAMSFIFVGLNCIGKKSEEGFDKSVKKRKILVACTFSGLMLVFWGKFFIHMDKLIILGAMILAPTLSVLIIIYIYEMMIVLKSKYRKWYEKILLKE